MTQLSVRKIMNLLLLVMVPGIQAATSLVTVVSNGGNLQLLDGWLDRQDWVARGNFSDDQLLDSGWLHLTVASNPGVSNRLQAEGAGLVEGFLTKDQITRYYQEFIHRDLCGVSADFCRWTRELLSRQRSWQEEQIRLKGQEPYWEQVGLFYVQMEGLKQGWLTRSRQEGGNVPQNFDQDWFAYFINFLPDISDYIHQYKAELAAKQGVGLRSGLPPLPKPAVPSCSVLVKRLPSSGKLVVGHATWHDYRALGHRFVKLYSLPFSLSVGETVPGHTISMTSYPGSLYSLDDFYVISSGLVTTESTLFVYDKSLYERNKPEGSVWEPVRAMTANRLARTGADWGGIFGRQNSGTYNNQWMVADVKSGRLWVTEQLPGSVTSKEVTEQVQTEGYWASYNRWVHSQTSISVVESNFSYSRAAFPTTYSTSGAADMEAEHGSWFSHDDTPRARLFAAGQESVEDAASMLQLLRSNSFTRSALAQPDGCSDKIPQAAIAARGDLQPEQVSCSWAAEDFMVGRRAYGAIDAKATTFEMVESLSFLAVSGPSRGGGNLPAFSWQGSGFTQPLHVPTDTFTFPPVRTEWSSSINAEFFSPTTTTVATTTTTAAAAVSVLPGPLALLQILICFLFSSYCPL